MRLTEELISKWHEGKFDFRAYKDHYRQKVKAAIEAKKNGVDLSTPEERNPRSSI